METILKRYRQIAEFLSKIESLPLLFMRLVLVYGFWTTGMSKWNYMDNVVDWFLSLGIPFPKLSAYLSASAEVGGAFLLVLGLGTRIISIPLMIVMLVAISFVHIHNGFEASNNGFEIPLYYLLMLFALFIFGSGKISLDFLIKKTL